MEDKIMRKFLINVNGTSYEVEVEEIGADGAVSAPAAPQQAPAPKAAAKPAANVAGTKVAAPMPGTIVDVKVKAGDKVTKGQILVIMEAMKMENEILAPDDGEVASVATTKGAQVESGELLVVLK